MTVDDALNFIVRELKAPSNPFAQSRRSRPSPRCCRFSVVHSDPDILGGTPVFQATRVPFRNLIDSLERGYSVEEFLDAFPSVTREQVVAALEAANEALSVRARSAR